MQFAGLAAKCDSVVDKASLTWVSNAITSLCESIKKTEIAVCARSLLAFVAIVYVVFLFSFCFRYVTSWKTSWIGTVGDGTGTGRDGTGRDGRDGTGRKFLGRDGTGRDGNFLEGTGRDGTGRDGTGKGVAR